MSQMLAFIVNKRHDRGSGWLQDTPGCSIRDDSKTGMSIWRLQVSPTVGFKTTDRS